MLKGVETLSVFGLVRCHIKNDVLITYNLILSIKIFLILNSTSKQFNFQFIRKFIKLS